MRNIAVKITLNKLLIEFYKENGIDKEFVKRFHRTPPEEMWYPRDSELLKQGIVTEVLND